MSLGSQDVASFELQSSKDTESLNEKTKKKEPIKSKKKKWNTMAWSRLCLLAIEKMREKLG